MKNKLWLVIFSLGLHLSLQHKDIDLSKFPDNFRFGVATSSYQIEGAWNISGKGENIWDYLVHTKPDKIKDRSTGDVACDSYHKFREDVALIKDMGLDFYRFSLSWARIFPTGHTNRVNPDGVRYYNDLIDELLENGIEPMVTLYHWDIPQSLQDLGGLTNPLIIEYFVNFARFAFEEFGDRVKLWLTFNEPKISCLLGYGSAMLAPMISSPGIGDYICAHNILRAHARIYHMYNNTFRVTQKGRISITLDTIWYEPATNLTQDNEAAERMMEFQLGWWANPIFHKNGDYPTGMKEFVAKRSQQEGYTKSRLPEFTKEEIRYIRGTYDFFGYNYYTALLIANDGDQPIGDPSIDKDARVKYWQDPSWPSGASFWLKVVPWAFRNTLNWIKNKYDNPEIIISENGFSDYGELNDSNRVRYFELHLQKILEAIHLDNVRISTYTAWSLMDNFEWVAGYTEKFGLYQVNFNHPNRTRTAKSSAKYYKEIVAQRRLVPSNLTHWNDTDFRINYDIV